jgi:hypothetical protein
MVNYVLPSHRPWLTPRRTGTGEPPPQRQPIDLVSPLVQIGLPVNTHAAPLLSPRELSGYDSLPDVQAGVSKDWALRVGQSVVPDPQGSRQKEGLTCGLERSAGEVSLPERLH